MPDKPITIAVSSCLLGERVRYDGDAKFSKHIAQLREMDFELLSVCPEVGIGLGVPRPRLHVVNIDEQIKVLGIENPQQDVTSALINYAQQILNQHPGICGYIFKSCSPSCGVSDTPVFNSTGEALSKGSGMFAKTVIEQAGFPVVDENCLSTPGCRVKFLEAVVNYNNKGLYAQ